MRKTIRKWFWAWQFDEEEKWLNEMASKGLALVAIGFCKYTFEECVPGEYNIRLELLDNVPANAESQQYIKFIEDTGAEYLGSITRWVYFRKKTVDGEFNLYSDNESRIKHINRLLALLLPVGFANITACLSNISIFFGSGFTFNLVCCSISFCFGLLIFIGAWRVYLKKKKLKKEHNLYE